MKGISYQIHTLGVRLYTHHNFFHPYNLDSRQIHHKLEFSLLDKFHNHRMSILKLCGTPKCYQDCQIDLAI